MSHADYKQKSIMWKFFIIILIWVVLIAVSFQARSFLTEGIESSQEFTEEDTESTHGEELFQERFNLSGIEVSQIIILHIPDDKVENLGYVQDNLWRNYTLYLSLYLNHTMFEKGYNTIISEPLLLQLYQINHDPDILDAAHSLVSDDRTSTLINLISAELNYEEDQNLLEDHVNKIRDLLADYDSFLEFVLDMETAMFLPTGTLTGYLPNEEDINEVDLILTGSAANYVDLIETAQKTFEESEVISVIVVTIILAIVFRSPLGMLVPLLAMVAALFPAYLLTFIMADAGLFVVNDFLPAIIAMIGIAVAVDYNLFSLVRYREEYRKKQAKLEEKGRWNKKTRRETRIESADLMNKTAGTAVMYSGITVMIGFTALIVLGDDFTLGMALGVSTVVLLSILSARTFTPAFLSIFGDWVDWPAIFSGSRREIERRKKTKKDRNGFWQKWSRLVMRFPITFLIIGLLTIAPFVALSSQTDLSFDIVKSLPQDTESREGFEILEEDFNLGQLNPYRIIIDGGASNNSVLNSQVINATNAFAEDVIEYEETREKDGTEMEFITVTSLSVTTNESTHEINTMTLEEIEAIYNSPDLFIVGPGPTIVPNVEKFKFIDYSANYMNWEHGNNTLVIEVTSNLDPGSAAAFELVHVLRDFTDEYFGPLIDDGVIEAEYVTGFSASFEDSRADLYGDVPLMLGIATILIFIALTILFRSLLLPLKAIITISGSILFGLGAMVFVFQQGNLLNIEIDGFTLWTAEQSGIVYFLPVFLFTTLLGLGMDYSIFIISRIREEYERGENMSDSVGIGLSKTAGVITSAATIMIATFLVFAASPMLILKSMGFAMAIAIFVDATIARIILLPAAMKLVGRYNFWLPGWLKKILPEIKLDH